MYTCVYTVMYMLFPQERPGEGGAGRGHRGGGLRRREGSGDRKGEPLVECYLFNAGVLQTWRAMQQIQCGREKEAAIVRN